MNEFPEELKWDGKAELEGIKAKRDCKLADSNPYSISSNAYYWWNKGFYWEDARQRDIEWGSYRPGEG